MRIQVLFPLLLGVGLAVGLVSSASSAPGDMVMARKVKGSSTPPAVFPHWAHRIRFKCYACHPSMYEMKSGTSLVSMDAITQGDESCGTCHNGKIAWAISFDNCSKCHTSP